MLFLRPQHVMLFNQALDGVSAVVVDREASRVALEWSDAGPHVVFADAPELKVTIRVTRALTRDEATPARPGDTGPLVFRVGAGADDAGVRLFSATVVVMGVRHSLKSEGGARQEIEMVAVSSGAPDPIAETVEAL